jgi:hypothetical protein
MIESYFVDVEEVINSIPVILNYELNKKKYNEKLGLLQGKLVFENKSKLNFIEIKNIDLSYKVKYRYQYMDECDQLIFRYDNAPHHINLNTFPHHKQIDSKILEHPEPKLNEILLEIALIVWSE